MSEGIDQKPECEHAWAHKSTSVGLWIPQCYLCGEFNNADLGQQIADVKADAWDEGLQAGWEECRNPDPFVNDWWDSKAPNPYRIEREA